MRQWKKVVPPAAISVGVTVHEYLRRFHEMDFVLHLRSNKTIGEVLRSLMTPGGVGILLVAVIGLALTVVTLRRKLAGQRTALAHTPKVEILVPERQEAAEPQKPKAKMRVVQQRIVFTKTVTRRVIDVDEDVDAPIEA